jgi:hypothetical protein
MTQQPPALPPPPPQYQPQPPFNTYAIIAIILATVVLPPLGIYFGHQAKKQIAVTGERGMELAQASIVVGWVLTGLMALSLLAFCGFFVIWLGFIGTTQP